MMKFSTKIKPFFCPRRPGEKSVRNDLAYTPTQMNLLTSQGRSVAMTTLQDSMYYDTTNGTVTMPIEYIRGIDENILWEIRQDAKERFSKFKKEKDNEKFLSSLNQGGNNGNI